MKLRAHFFYSLSIPSKKATFLGEAYARKGRLLAGEGDTIKKSPRFNVEGMDLGNKQSVIADELIVNGTKGRLGEIKVGYDKTGIDPKQIRNYIDLIKRSARDPKVKEQLTKMGMPEGARLRGVDYLFLPGAKGKNAHNAAKKALNDIRQELGADIANDYIKSGFIKIKYLDNDGIVKTL